MKLIILLFSFYMLALPVVAQQVDSCVETEVCAEAEDQCIDEACSGEEEGDDCGSFCACSCCVHIVSVNLQSTATVEKAVEKNILSSFYHTIFLPSSSFGNIWQPPRTA